MRTFWLLKWNLPWPPVIKVTFQTKQNNLLPPASYFHVCRAVAPVSWMCAAVQNGVGLIASFLVGHFLGPHVVVGGRGGGKENETRPSLG